MPRLFVLDKAQRLNVVQAYSLGCEDVIKRPLRTADIISSLRPLINKSVEKQWNNLSKTQQTALRVSLTVFEDTMATVQSGKPLPAHAILENSKLIIQATAHEDVTTWMDAVKDHHNYSYRHSMLVCGFLVSFAHLIGIRGADLQKLAVGGCPS